MGHIIELATCSAPINIAIIKYWGKRCKQLNLPLNDSISVTLHQNDLKAVTTAATSQSFVEDRVWLNEKEVDIRKNERIKACFSEVRKTALKQALDRGETSCELNKYNQKVHICSKNNFPTAAGLASSAAGYAALVSSLSRLFKVEGDVSAIARRGSGSACRSMYGGFVEWVEGKDDHNGLDSISNQLYSQKHWPELRVFILVISDRKKDTGSTDGMQQSVETSSLLSHRVVDVVPKRVVALKDAIASCDFPAFAEICMKESNQLHAVCRDTYPPLQYLNDTSQWVINFVHAYNKQFKSHHLAYTYDAGPNAFLFTLDSYAREVAQSLHYFFGPSENGYTASKFIRGIDISREHSDESSLNFKRCPDLVNYVIMTKPGPGPVQLTDQDLISSETGLPSC